MPGASRSRMLAIAEAYLLVRHFSRRITRVAEDSLGRGHASNRDIEVVLLLRHGACSPSQIADRVGAPRASISRTLRRLGAAGLTASAKDAADGRGRHVALSGVAQARVRAFAEELAACIDDELPALEAAAAHARIEVAPVPVADREDALARAEAMARAGGRFQTEVGGRLADYGITSTRQQHTLALLLVRDGERPARLADDLGLTTQATTAMLDHLVDKGLVIRESDADPSDRRTVRVSLTAEGIEATQVLLSIFGKQLRSVIGAIVTPGG